MALEMMHLVPLFRLMLMMWILMTLCFTLNFLSKVDNCAAVSELFFYPLLYRCRRQLQNRAAHASSTELTPNGAALAAPEVKNAEPVKQEDAASVVRARVMELHAAERLIQTEDHKSVAVEGQEPATSADVKIEGSVVSAESKCVLQM